MHSQYKCNIVHIIKVFVSKQQFWNHNPIVGDNHVPNTRITGQKELSNWTTSKKSELKNLYN